MSVPLEVEDTGGRSGWHTVNDDPPATGRSRPHSGYGLLFTADGVPARPPGTSRALPMEALQPDLKYPRNHVHKRRPVVGLGTPRFDVPSGPLVHRLRLIAVAGQQQRCRRLQPRVQPGDPRPEPHRGDPRARCSTRIPDGQGSNVAQRWLRRPCLSWSCPPSTPVTLVNWHDKEPQLYVPTGSRWNAPQSLSRARARLGL